MAAPTPDYELDRVAFWAKVEETLKKENSEVFTELQNLRDGEENTAELPSNVPSLADEFVRVIQRKKDDMETRQWKWPHALHKDEGKIRDSMDRLVSAAKNISTIAKGLVQLDTTGYAKLGWLPFNIVIDVSDISSLARPNGSSVDVFYNDRLSLATSRHLRTPWMRWLQ
jgi:hypothetical protein